MKFFSQMCEFFFGGLVIMECLADNLAGSYCRNVEFNYDVPKALIAVWLACGSDFQLSHDLKTDDGLDRLVYWWLSEGQSVFLGLSDNINRELFESMHLKLLRDGAGCGEVMVTPLLQLIMRHRNDLHDFFDISTQDGVCALWRWWLKDGQIQYLVESKWFMQEQIGIFFSYNIYEKKSFSDFFYWWLSVGRSELSSIDEYIDRIFLENLHFKYLREYNGCEIGLLVTPLLGLILENRSDLKNMFDTQTEKGVAALWFWWLNYGQSEYLESPKWFECEQLDILHRCDIDLEHINDGLSITPLLKLLWLHNTDINARISLDTLAGREALWQHFFTAEAGIFSLPRAGMPFLPNLHSPQVPTPVLLVYSVRADLRCAFDIGNKDGVDGLMHWWVQHGFVYPDLWDYSLACLAWLFEPLKGNNATLIPLLSLIVKQRPDLCLPDIHTQVGCEELVYWWLVCGWRLYPVVADLARRTLAEILHLKWLPSMAADGVLGVTPLLRIILLRRPDLLAVVEGEGGYNVKKLWWWWLTEGQVSYLGAPDWLVSAQGRWLHCCEGNKFGETKVILPTLLMSVVADVVPASGTGGVCSPKVLWSAIIQYAETLGLPNHGMPYFNSSVASGLKFGAAQGFEPLFADFAAIIYMVRSDIAQAFDLTQPDGLRGLIDWYLQFAIQEYPRLADPLGAGPRVALGRPMPGSHAVLDIPAIGWLFALSRAAGDPVVQGADDAPAQEAWWNRAGKAKYRTIPADVLMPVGEKSALAPQGGVASAEAESDLAISLVGYPRGEFGLGEDIRLLRASMQSVELNPTVVRAPWTIIARQGADEPSIEAALAEFGTDVMFYVMPAFDTATLLAKVGVRAFSARRRIGFWQWELEHFPEPAKVAMELVDEIWCHSEHSARAFREATDKPVIKVPLPVAVPEVCSVDRAEFDLPDDGFVVFTSFDGASSISRKNPLGAILAFQRAFPAHEHPQARLVIKAMNTLPDSLWHECLRKAVIDPRILIRNEVMDRARYYELLKACDAVISLHRAEGFGRLMAEAMGLGIPVIATAYSGNMDFMTEENSWLVGGDMVPVFAGDYAFYSGQRWMEPDIAIAARALRECADNPVMRAAKIAAARKTIAQYSPSRCGEVYKTLLAGG
ncbi:glycosyltransferase [Acetobacter papayae]|uniref:glycosyltransferase n=1 Tax=Acetobacter papayae TaxID=1076592 RepID=UPI0039EBDA05